MTQALTGPAVGPYGGTVPVADISATGPTATPVQHGMELAREYGPAFVRRLHGRDVLFVSDPDLVAELSDEQRFAKAVGPALENVREFTADGLFTAYNEEPNWARAHDILLPAFALGSMRTYHPVMLQVAHRVLDSWDAHAAAGTPVPVPEDMTRMTLDTIGLAGFGYDFDSFSRSEPHPFVSAMVRCLEWSMKRLGRAPGGDYTQQDAAFRADATYLASVVDEVVAARQAAGDTGESDLLGLMLNATHPRDGSTLDAANIRNQVITFLIAGHETTSSALSFALHYLARHPTVLRLAQREADELWGDTDPVQPTFEDVAKLRWTRQVLHEALRLWPTAPGFGRQAREDTLLGGRLPLRAGEVVTVQTPMLHRAALWGDNPESFDPTRFAPEVEEGRPVHAYKPFGTGERACIGRQFALHEATMLLGMLVHRYRLGDDPHYRLRIKETLTLKPDGLSLTLTRRTSADRSLDRAALATVPSTRPGAEADTAAPADTGLPSRVLPGTGLLVLHGSNYGTCREFAQQLADLAQDVGCSTETAPLDAYVGQLPGDRPVVLVAASYNGRPTDDAAAFTEWLESAETGATDGLTYAVLGVGDRNWAATYQRVPTLLDERLAAAGGNRLLPRAAADASGDLDGTVREFSTALRTALLRSHGDPDTIGAPAAQPDTGPAHTVTVVSGEPQDGLARRHGLTRMTVTEAADLTAPGHPRRKRLLRLALPDGTAYRTADHLAVLPTNDPALVARAAAVLGADEDTVLHIQPRGRRGGLPVDGPLTVRELLGRHLELQDRPTAAQLAELADANPCPPEQAALARLTADEDARAADPRTLLDILEDHPALREVLDWPQLLELFPQLRTRHYSISSTPRTCADHADLMVSVLEAPARSGRGTYRGTGSGHLARLAPGDEVWARVQPCREAFRVPHRPDTPLILVAAGTGLAPFRGAVADRSALLDQGAELAPALLYFGCDHPEVDFLHAAELRAAEDNGAVSLRPAYSEAPRDGVQFVQHRIAAEGAEVWRLLEQGARVYVCGDGSRMAPGVRAALRELYVHRHSGAGEQAAEEWLQQLTADGRYTEDVYAAG